MSTRDRARLRALTERSFGRTSSATSRSRGGRRDALDHPRVGDHHVAESGRGRRAPPRAGRRPSPWACHRPCRRSRPRVPRPRHSVICWSARRCSRTPGAICLSWMGRRSSTRAVGSAGSSSPSALAPQRNPRWILLATSATWNERPTHISVVAPDYRCADVIDEAQRWSRATPARSCTRAAWNSLPRSARLAGSVGLAPPWTET